MLDTLQHSQKIAVVQREALKLYHSLLFCGYEVHRRLLHMDTSRCVGKRVKVVVRSLCC